MSEINPSNSNINFDDFCELLIPLNALNSPSELHGYLCGRLSGGATLTEDEWQQAAWDLLNSAEAPSGEAREYVSTLYNITTQQLTSGEYDLSLFLPDDDNSLEQRTQALSQWCHGFLTGFGSAGINPETYFASEQADALRDLSAIVQATTDEGQDEEEQEAGFAELVEYIRMVTLNFYEDLKPESHKAQSKKVVH